MRTSLNEIETIERYLSGKLPLSEKLLFEAKLLVSPDLSEKVGLQRLVVNLAKAFGRKQLKKQIQATADYLFHSPEHHAFQKDISLIFKK